MLSRDCFLSKLDIAFPIKFCFKKTEKIQDLADVTFYKDLLISLRPNTNDGTTNFDNDANQ